MGCGSSKRRDPGSRAQSNVARQMPTRNIQPTSQTPPSTTATIRIIPPSTIPASGPSAPSSRPHSSDRSSNPTPGRMRSPSYEGPFHEHRRNHILRVSGELTQQLERERLTEPVAVRDRAEGSGSRARSRLGTGSTKGASSREPSVAGSVSARGSVRSGPGSVAGSGPTSASTSGASGYGSSTGTRSTSTTLTTTTTTGGGGLSSRSTTPPPSQQPQPQQQPQQHPPSSATPFSPSAADPNPATAKHQPQNLRRQQAQPQRGQMNTFTRPIDLGMSLTTPPTQPHPHPNPRPQNASARRPPLAHQPKPDPREPSPVALPLLFVTPPRAPEPEIQTSRGNATLLRRLSGTGPVISGEWPGQDVSMVTPVRMRTLDMQEVDEVEVGFGRGEGGSLPESQRGKGGDGERRAG